MSLKVSKVCILEFRWHFHFSLSPFLLNFLLSRADTHSTYVYFSSVFCSLALSRKQSIFLQINNFSICQTHASYFISGAINLEFGDIWTKNTQVAVSSQEMVGHLECNILLNFDHVFQLDIQMLINYPQFIKNPTLTGNISLSAFSQPRPSLWRAQGGWPAARPPAQFGLRLPCVIIHTQQFQMHPVSSEISKFNLCFIFEECCCACEDEANYSTWHD